MSRDPDNAFFTDGVQDQVLTALAKVADLKVISRTSVMQYKSGVARNLREIAQQLGVTHVLEGSVQRAGNKVRVNAQLINAHTDAHEWADNYDRPVDDVFAIQSEIAKAIADQLQAKLSPKEKSAIEQAPTRDLVAFDLYSRAKSLMLTTSFSAIGGQNLRKAVDLLEQALARDSSFFLAQCQLAYAHDNLYFLGLDHTPARLAAAQAAVLDRTLSIKPDDVETKVVRALLPLDWKADTRPLHQALDEIRRSDPEAIKSVADTWFLCALAERDGAAAESALVALDDNVFG